MNDIVHEQLALPRSLLVMLNAMKEMVPQGPLGSELKGRMDGIEHRIHDLMMQLSASHGHTAESMRVLQSILETMKELTPPGMSGERINHEIEEKSLEVRDLLRKLRGSSITPPTSDRE